MDAFCVKCRVKREIANAAQTKTAKNKPMVKGNCSVCGTTMVKFGAATNA